MVPGLRNLSYEGRLRRLDLPTTVYRRIRDDMIEVYKIMTGKYFPGVNIKFQIRVCTTRGNSIKIFKPRCRTRQRQGTFTHRVVDKWNSLPRSVVQANNTHSFEIKLDKHWDDQDVKFNFKETFKLSTATSYIEPEDDPDTQV